MKHVPLNRFCCVLLLIACCGSGVPAATAAEKPAEKPAEPPPRRTPLESTEVEGARPQITLKKEALQSTLSTIIDSSDTVENRVNAIGLAGLAQLREALPALGIVLTRPDNVDVKVAAIWALREIDDPAAIPVLLLVQSQAVGPQPVLRYDKKVEFADAGVEMTLPELIEDSIGRLGEGVLDQYLKALQAPSGSYQSQSEKETNIQRSALAVIICVGDRDYRSVEMMSRILSGPAEMYPPDFREAAALGLARVLVARTKEFSVVQTEDKVGDEITKSLVNYALTLEPSATREYLASALNLSRPIYAVTLLTEHFADNSPDEVRLRTIELLGMLRSRESVEALTWALENEKNPELRWRAAYGLGLTGEPGKVVEPLRKALQSDSPEVRQAAITSLGRLHDAGAIPLLDPALHDLNPKTRIITVRALGMIGDKAAIPPLVAAAGDSDVVIRSTALAALGALPSSESLTALCKAVRDPDRQVRYTAMKVLEDVHVPAAYAALLQLVSDPDRTIGSEVTMVLRLAMEKHPKALKAALVHVIADPNYPASAEACEFAQFPKDTDVIAALRKATVDPRPAVRASALKALADMGLK